jgi:hypothetical protein
MSLRDHLPREGVLGTAACRFNNALGFTALNIQLSIFLPWAYHAVLLRDYVVRLRRGDLLSLPVQSFQPFATMCNLDLPSISVAILDLNLPRSGLSGLLFACVRSLCLLGTVTSAY